MGDKEKQVPPRTGAFRNKSCPRRARLCATPPVPCAVIAICLGHRRGTVFVIFQLSAPDLALFLSQHPASDSDRDHPVEQGNRNGPGVAVGMLDPALQFK